MMSGKCGSFSMVNFRFLLSEICLKVVSTNEAISLKRTLMKSAEIYPDSIFERSRMSLIS